MVLAWSEGLIFQELVLGLVTGRLGSWPLKSPARFPRFGF